MSSQVRFCRSLEQTTESRVIYAHVHTDSTLILVVSYDFSSGPSNTLDYINGVSQNGAATPENWFLSGCVTEYGESVGKANKLVVNHGGLWLRTTAEMTPTNHLQQVCSHQRT